MRRSSGGRVLSSPLALVREGHRDLLPLEGSELLLHHHPRLLRPDLDAGQGAGVLLAQLLDVLELGQGQLLRSQHPQQRRVKDRIGLDRWRPGEVSPQRPPQAIDALPYLRPQRQQRPRGRHCDPLQPQHGPLGRGGGAGHLGVLLLEIEALGLLRVLDVRAHAAAAHQRARANLVRVGGVEKRDVVGGAAVHVRARAGEGRHHIARRGRRLGRERGEWLERDDEEANAWEAEAVFCVLLGPHHRPVLLLKATKVGAGLGDGLEVEALGREGLAHLGILCEARLVAPYPPRRSGLGLWSGVIPSDLVNSLKQRVCPSALQKSLMKRAR
mmetsp:Transcript_22569/g.70038  ORF Transcript_22569/g.70038 Transcript_22569/m.70038 type:complete len:328 (+) Transcript_22569:176-1159(+)